MLKEFKEFAMKGNIVDLAVGVVIGGAFQKIVNSLVQDIIMPAISVVTGKVDFSDMVWTIGDVSIKYGNFITSIVDFLIIAFSIFLVIKYCNKLNKLNKIKELGDKAVAKFEQEGKSLKKKLKIKEKEQEEKGEVKPETKVCPYCLSEIKYEATRCPYCTSTIKDNSDNIENMEDINKKSNIKENLDEQSKANS